MKNISKFMAATLLASHLVYAPITANAGEGVFAAENWQIRVRTINVAPDVDSSVNIGGKTDVDNAVVPEIDFTYFFTEKIGAELILATAKHEIDYNDTTDLGDAWILPPTLTLQYHPLRGEGNFSPYFGAGVNYSLFYGEDTATGFTDLDVDGGFGLALQAGADYWLDDHWGLNLDVKKLWLEIDGELNNGAVTTDIDLDPWIVGVGVSYRF